METPSTEVRGWKLVSLLTRFVQPIGPVRYFLLDDSTRPNCRSRAPAFCTGHRWRPERGPGNLCPRHVTDLAVWDKVRRMADEDRAFVAAIASGQI
jgi:hypothetical protein